MHNTLLKIYVASLLIIAPLAINAQVNTTSAVGSSSSEQLSKLRGSGMAFTQNKGQIADSKGNSCPDVLYRGNGNNSDIYLRKTGISYVFSNTDEVMGKIDEQVEELLSAGIMSQIDEQNKKEELLQKEKIIIHRIDIDFEGANTNCRLINDDELDGYNNYYYAHCPQGITNVPQYNKVTYKNIYKGIDVSYYGDKQNGLKYDLIVQPHADPKQIKLHWQGAESIHINREGNLVIKTSVNEFVESIPKVYQIIDGKIVDVKTEYKLNRREKKGVSKSHVSCLNSHIYEVTFSFSTYNSSFPLIIDPWVSYYGGSGNDYGSSVATDVSGNVVFTGFTTSLNLPLSIGSYQAALSGGLNNDLFIVKMNASGNLLWATYYGGLSDDQANAITTDAAENVIVSGNTTSVGFPGTTSGSVHQNFLNGTQDAFLLKLSPTGLSVWATYYGGSGADEGIDVTTNGNDIYFYGNTFSTNSISTPATFQTSISGSQDVFVVKFDAAGNRVWGTYIGGTGDETCGSIAYDTVTANIYLAGYTTSVNFPVSLSPHQTSNGGGTDAFLFKLDPTGTNRLWATYYGGTATDWGVPIATDGLGNVILGGITYSSDINVISSPGAYEYVFGGGIYQDGFIVKFNSLGARQWGTYFGGSAAEHVLGLVTDPDNNIYAYGEFEDGITKPYDYPASACAYQTLYASNSYSTREDQFLAKYDPEGRQHCITYMGGPLEDDLENYTGGFRGSAIAIFGNNLYITGLTKGGYPVTPGAFQTVYGGGAKGDAFIASLCINLCEAKLLDLNFNADQISICKNTPVVFTASVANSCDTTGYRFHWEFLGGNPANSDAVNPTVTFPAVGSYDVKLMLTTTCRKDSLIKTNYITTTQCNVCTLLGQFTKGAAVCSNCGCKEWVLVNAINGTPPYTYLWPDGYDKRYKNKICPGSYTVKVIDKNGCSVDVNITAP